MKKIIIACTICIAGFFPGNAFAAQVIGFGYFENKSDNHDYDYLVKIFPNSFAASMEANYDASTVKTGDIEDILAGKDSALKMNYSDKELFDLAQKLPVDYFIYGSFMPLDDNNIEITVNIYKKSTQELLSFTSNGRMETEIFNLVDRITVTFDDFIRTNFKYKSADIPAGSRVAFITNLSGDELNEFYIAFMNKKFTVSSLQGNDLETPIELRYFDKLQYLTLKSKKLERIRTADPLIFHTSSWHGSNYIAAQKNFKDSIAKYYYQYPEMQEQTLKELSTRYKFNVDFLFIVGCNTTRTNAWVRVFDLRKYSSSVIWMQNGIESKDYTGTSGIAESIIEQFITKEQQ